MKMLKELLSFRHSHEKHLTSSGIPKHFAKRRESEIKADRNTQLKIRKEFDKLKKLKVPKDETMIELDKGKMYAIAMQVTSIVGDTFPDKNPLEALMPFLEKYGIRDFEVMNVFNESAKIIGPYKDFYDYLSDVWETFIGEHPDITSQGQNPWK